MEEVPLDEKEAAQWLHKLYQEKVKGSAFPGLGERGLSPGGFQGPLIGWAGGTWTSSGDRSALLFSRLLSDPSFLFS